MLRFIFGRSGSGKSFYIHQKIKELYEHGKEKIMLIVPEQFSFESERQIYKLLGACSAKNIEVYSFSRLSEMIFRTYGRLAGKYATEPQKSILMNVALNEIKDGLNVYQKSVGQKSFIQTMKSLIGEFKSANVTPSILEEISQKIESEPLKNKTNEIALIYSTYDAFLSESYMDSLDKISKAAKKVRGTDFFKGYTIFFDEFKSFTANENEIIEQMISDAEDTYFSLCLDSTEDEKLGIFSVVYETYQKLVRFARQTGTTVAVPIKIKSGARFKNKELSHLEQNIFSCKPSTFKSNEPENIVFAFAQNEYQEAEYALSTIKELVQKNGYRYDDFAIISRDLDTYISALESEFEKYEIPYYMDKREGIEQKALIRFVVLFLRIATQGYNTENILSMLKCGLSPYDSDRISELENYCFVWDIKAKRWLEEFKANPSGFVSVLSEQDEALLTRVNQVREYVVSSVEMFKRKSGKISSGELSQALYEAIESMGTREEVEHIIAQSEQNEDLILAQDYVKIWDILMDIMDILAKTVAHVAITPKRYLELFELVTDEYDMGTLPQTLDSVIVGSAERIRTNNPKVTIILGANQGILPFVPEDSGLFSDAERKLLTQTGLEFSGDVQYKILEERFVAYKALTSSSEKLVVTARRSDLTGKAIRPSEIFSFASEV
ncbi:MAG: helicase, partial [Oscillospiraceae bacterium]|nr:helicase [Oscillospiraceae bacterium]